MPNRLIHESSPYLLQHAHNPVDWFPWGEEALQRAREEDKPILLSIGYASCHWCHVMERESFEDPGTARVMNQNFINIKVDREERPDLDSLYMQAVQAMTGRGGWPLTVFLTPEGKPFFGSTYFPPQDRAGLPAFPRVLEAVARTHRERRQEVERAAREIVGRLEQATETTPPREPLTADLLHSAFGALARGFDYDHGGFGTAPKFPQPMLLEFLLRYYQRTADARALAMAELALQAMAAGGIYDQLGGGFHRYATDAAWAIPHFEKMLYDNALLARLYLHAYQLTANPLYRRISGETLGFLLQDLADPGGGFHSALDADSEGEEGKYYVWTLREIREALGEKTAELAVRHFELSEEGNFEGRNVLRIAREGEKLATEMGLGREEVDRELERAKEELLRVRQRRVPPGRDDKVLTAWNGLAIAALAEAGAALGEAHYLRAARGAARFLLQNLRPGGRLMRSFRNGQVRVPGYLEDYAFLSDGLLTLYQATLEAEWLEEARLLAGEMVRLFWSQPQGAFYDTAADAPDLVLRPRGMVESALPSASAMAALVLLHLGALTGDGQATSIGGAALRSARELMAGYPAGAGQWLAALGFYLSVPVEITLVGEPAELAPFLASVHQLYLPNKVVLGGSPGDPRLGGKGMAGGNAAAHVCRDYSCLAPVTDPGELRRLLAQRLAQPG